MSYFYHDDEEDYYHGGSNLHLLKSSFESGKEKFTVDSDDEEDSPQFAGSFQMKKATQVWGGAQKTKQKISLREAFGGSPGSSSESDSEDDEIDIFGGSPDSDSDVSDEDVKTVKAAPKAKLNNVEERSLNNYKKLREKKKPEPVADDDFGGSDFPTLSPPKAEPKAAKKKYGGCDLHSDFSDDDLLGGSSGVEVVGNPFDW